MFEPLTLDRNAKLLNIPSQGALPPVEVFSWHEDEFVLPPGATYFGMVTRGVAIVAGADARPARERAPFCLSAGMFFVLEGPCRVSYAWDPSTGLAIGVPGYKGYPQIGGPLEERGRLKYIDGCSDTLLVCAPVVGEPCLNHLHIPPGTNQTQHTHPSERIGVILRGSGYCETPEGRFDLREGMGWRIPPGQVHSFHTGPDEFLDVIAWHPDSEFGPSHEAHPMVSRTYVNGVAASEIPDIQTKELLSDEEIRAQRTG